jgi:uncharacterized protein YuzE
MRITYDKNADAVYVYIRDDKVSRSDEITSDTIIDYDKDGKVIGIEILFASSRMPMKDLIAPGIEQLA